MISSAWTGCPFERQALQPPHGSSPPCSVTITFYPSRETAHQVCSLLLSLECGPHRKGFCPAHGFIPLAEKITLSEQMPNRSVLDAQVFARTPRGPPNSLKCSEKKVQNGLSLSQTLWESFPSQKSALLLNYSFTINNCSLFPFFFPAIPLTPSSLSHPDCVQQLTALECSRHRSRLIASLLANKSADRQFGAESVMKGSVGLSCLYFHKLRPVAGRAASVCPTPAAARPSCSGNSKGLTTYVYIHACHAYTMCYQLQICVPSVQMIHSICAHIVYTIGIYVYIIDNTCMLYILYITLHISLHVTCLLCYRHYICCFYC